MAAAEQAKSLRYLINFRLALASLFIVALSSLIVIWQARQSVKNELESSLNLAAQLVQLNFPSQIQNTDKVNLDAWLSRFVSLEQTRHLTIKLIQANGNILSFAAKDKNPNNTSTPNFFVNLTSVEAPKIQRQLTLQNGNHINLVIQADPSDEIAEAWLESRNLFSILLTMAAVIFFAVNLLFKKTFKAIDIIVNNLKAIETGRYQPKLPAFAIKEYGQIALAINHMCEALVATNEENQALTRHNLKIQEQERRHLAKELHDELGQSLTAIKVMAATTKNSGAKISEIANTVISICDHLLAVVRSMMRDLHPLVLTELGLKASLEDLVNQWSQRQPELRITLSCPDNIDHNLSADTSIQIFRICQEGLTNIIRHAEAASARIELVNLGVKHLRLTILDDGKGCNSTDTKKGFGLLGIRERVISLGGELTLKTSAQQGLAVTAVIPLP